MKKTLFLKKIDYLFLYTLLFFVSFIVFNYFIKSRILCFVVSFLFGYLLYRLTTFFITKRSGYVLAKKQDQQNIELLQRTLISSGTIFALDYLKTALNGKLTTFGIESNDSIYYIDLSKQTLTLHDMNRIKCTILQSNKTKYIIAQSIDNELSTFLQNIKQDIKFLDFKTLYFMYIKDKIKLPSIEYEQKPQQKNTLKSLIKIAFSKDKARGYFINGILIFLFSFLYPFRNYYMIFSLILFVFSIMCIFEPFKNY